MLSLNLACATRAKWSSTRRRRQLSVYQESPGSHDPLKLILNSFSGDLASAVNILQLFCSSPKPSLRFAAVRTLNKISIHYPQAVMSCNVDLEQLITDQNRSIATLAITTLLKTGSEASVERLMKQISSVAKRFSLSFSFC